MNGCIIRELVVLVKFVPSCYQPHSYLSITLEFLPYLGEVADKEFYVIKGCMKRSSMPFRIFRTGLERSEDISNIFKLLPIISYKDVITKLLPVIFCPGYKFLVLLQSDSDLI